MPTITIRTAFAAAGSVANVLLGSQYELAPFNGTMQVGITVTVVNACTFSLFAGPDVLQEPGGIIPFYGTEQMPRYPDDYHWEDEVAHGDRLKVGLVATAACNVNTSVRINPS